jgi:hypothetical protein
VYIGSATWNRVHSNQSGFPARCREHKRSFKEAIEVFQLVGQIHDQLRDQIEKFHLFNRIVAGGGCDHEDFRFRKFWRYRLTTIEVAEAEDMRVSSLFA